MGGMGIEPILTLSPKNTMSNSLTGCLTVRVNRALRLRCNIFFIVSVQRAPKDSNVAFTLLDSDSDKVSDSVNITVHSYRAVIRFGSRIGIGSFSVNTP